MKRFLVLLAALVTGLLWSGTAGAAPGDLVGTVHFSQDCSSGIGVGIAYDGAGHLWVSCAFSTPDLLRADSTTGAVDQTYNINGGLGALAYDATRNAIWAGPGCGGVPGIHLIQLDASKSVTGSSFAFDPGGSCLDDGLAYDATDDTLYYSPDGSVTISHYQTNGTFLGSFFWTGLGCYNSGLAIGGTLLFQGSDGCSHVWVVDKTTLAAAFDFSTAVAGDPNFRDEGLTCDTDTFKPTQVMWSKEAYSPNRAAAFEIPEGTCGVGGQPGPGPPATLTLSPKTATNVVGTEHCVTAHVEDDAGAPVPGVTVDFSVSGPNGPQTGQATTDANGDATFCYTGTVVGTDTIVATAEGGSNPRDNALKRWEPGRPAKVTLTPPTATNVIDSKHCVTATVTDAFGNPVPGATVLFEVSGSVSTSGSETTDASGQATFCYTGPALPGSDTITATVDLNGNGKPDAGEPSATAEKRWVLPESTPGCKVTYGGRITAANGDMATFGGNAFGTGPSGQEEYQDHGPAADLNVHSITILAVTCSADGTSASIFGTATINGGGSVMFRIDVQDLGEPGTSDTYRIRFAGYDSGVQTLNHGNIQIH